MSNNITETDILKAIDELMAKGIEPTQNKVRDFLGRGSRGTIHKYLSEWKKDCLQKGLKEGSEVPGNVPQIIEEKRILELNYKNKVAQLETYSKELIDSEKSLIEQKSENMGLKIELEKTKKELQEVISQKDKFESLFNELRAERGSIFDKISFEKDKIINDLRAELKTVHEITWKEITDIARNEETRLIDEKCKVIYLNDEVKILKRKNQDLTISNQDFQQKFIKLTRELNYYKKMVETLISKDSQEQFHEEHFTGGFDLVREFL